MNDALLQSIEYAIHETRLIEFIAAGHRRVCEPHVLGVQHNGAAVLTYQVGGGSSAGGLPQWRRFNLRDIHNLRVTEVRFNGARPTQGGQHSPFDRTIAVVGRPTVRRTGS